MQKSLIYLVLALLNLKFFAQGQPDSWIGIDCGSNRSTATFGLIWQPDEEFIKSGTNRVIPDDTTTSLAIFQTLRVFTDQNKNCYTLPRTSSYGYFIRAAFLYANYDGLSRPPTFDLEIDGNKWTTVVTSSTDYTYYEILYWTQNRNISVCLARTQNDQFPFISSLESWTISYDMYTVMSHDMAWLKSYRYDYGPNNGILGYVGGDSCNRIWEAISIPGTFNTSGGSVYSCDQNAPLSAIEDAIEAQDNATSLFLSFNPIKTATPIYIEAYFTQMDAGFSDTRSFDMYVGGINVGTITPSDDYSCNTQAAFAQVSSSNLSIELRPTAESTLPPIISAIEIYTASDPLVTTGTDQRDLNGVMSFTSSYDRLKGWSGEPCLPVDTVWQWLGCTATQPPRVTSIYLSGYQLNGPLPNFSQMQALVDIDLSKNNLTGEIPAFLGQLPNLRTLNLSYNDFSGVVPPSIRNNRKLAYDITGNPNLDSGKNGISKATIIGLAVGIPLLVAVIVVVVVFWVIRRRANHQGGTEAETGNGSDGQQYIQTAHPSAPPAEKDDEEDEYVEINAIDIKPKEESMVPDMELDELEDLIHHYADDGDHHSPIHASNDHSMVPDLDLEELHQIINREKDRAHEFGTGKSDN
ncbi:hypothetical protein C2S52_017192 [Perilla frutescens var. hirtella]|nr:hypothetical protein C2S52_017192 [Perilla frutescens var. hirtella]